MSDKSVHSEDCPAISFIYDDHPRVAWDRIPLECYAGLPQSAALSPVAGALKAPEKINIIERLSDLKEDKDYSGWTILHALKLRVPPQGCGQGTKGLPQSESSNTV